MRQFLWLWGPLEPQEESHKWSFFFNLSSLRQLFFPTGKSNFGIFWLFAREKITCRSSRLRVLSLEVVASVPKFAWGPNLLKIYQNLSNSVVFRSVVHHPFLCLFKPIVNDDYHQEHKEFWWRVSLSHFSLWNEEEKAFVFVGSKSFSARNLSFLIEIFLF